MSHPLDEAAFYHSPDVPESETGKRAPYVKTLLQKSKRTVRDLRLEAAELTASLGAFPDLRFVLTEADWSDLRWDLASFHDGEQIVNPETPPVFPAVVASIWLGERWVFTFLPLTFLTFKGGLDDAADRETSC